MFQDSIYMPQKYSVLELKDECLKHFIPNTIKNKNGISYLTIGDYKKTAIYCYGNSSSAIKLIEFAKIISTYYSIKIVLFDYPGFGDSSGFPSEENNINALQTMINMFKNSVLIGHSIGSGVILSCIKKYGDEDVKRIILMAPFKSLLSVVTSNILIEMLYPLLSNDLYLNSWNIQFVTCRITIFVLENDTIINDEHSKLIFSRIRNRLDNKYISFRNFNYDHSSFVTLCYKNFDL